VADSLTPRPADLTSENVQKKPEKELLTIIRDGAVEYFSYFPFSSAYERQKPSRDNYKGMFKKARPARPQSLGRAERTEEYVSTAKRRERRWRHFSTLPRWKGGNLHAILEGRVIRQAHAGCSGLSPRIGKVILTAEGNSENGPGSG
jgi:hypothetical protein